MKRLLSILLITFLFSQVVYGDEGEKNVQKIDLSFEQAYELMLENNNSLKAYNEDIEKSKYEKKAALGEFSPKVFLNSTYIHFSDDIELHTPVSLLGSELVTVSHIQDKNVFELGGGIVWNIFTGGKLLSNNAAKRAQLEISNAKYREIKDNLTVEVVKRYYGLILAKAVSSVKKENMDCIENHLKDALILEKEGIISKVERLHAQVAYSEAQKDYNASLRDINIVEEGLKTLIKSENANLQYVQINPISNLIMMEDFSIDTASMKANALKNNPQLKQLEEKKKIMNAKYHAKNADFLPTVSLFASDIFASSHLSETIPHGAVGGSVNWMLFDGLKRENNSIAAKHERQKTDYEIEDAKYNIEALVIKQYNELMKQKENYESAKTSLLQASEALRVANLAFKEGFGTSLQVTDAQTMLLKVQTERLNSIYNFYVILTDLLKTNGDTKEIFNYIIANHNLEN